MRWIRWRQLRRWRGGNAVKEEELEEMGSLYWINEWRSLFLDKKKKNVELWTVWDWLTDRLHGESISKTQDNII